MDFEIIKYSAKDAKDWNAFVSTAKNGLFFFNRSYMDYHADRFTDHSLIIRKKNKMMAVFPATENKNEIVSHGGLTFGALLLSHAVKMTEVLAVFQEIKHYYRNLFFKKIIYKCIPHIFHQYPADEDLYALFRLDAKLVRRDVSSVIEITNRIKFSETKRQLVKKCEALEIAVAENTDFSEYWELLTTVLKKFEAKPVHNLTEISSLHDSFPTNIKLYEARKDDELLAGIVIFDFGNVIHTQYMAASDQGRKAGALDYINSVLLEKYEDRKYYSFGISTENQGKFLNEGLIQQKENMGGRAVCLDFYEIPLHND